MGTPAAQNCHNPRGRDARGKWYETMNTNGKKEKAGRRAGSGKFGILALAAILGLPAAGTAQHNDHEHRSLWADPHGEFFLYSERIVATGGFHSFAGHGSGLGAGGTLFLNDARNAALRVEGRLSDYDGSFSHPPIGTMGMNDMRLRTDATVFSAGIGPQIYILTGSVRPYVYGTLGFSRVVGDVNARGSRDGEILTRSVSLDGTGVAVNTGGGISVKLRTGDRPVAVDVSASYQNNGIADRLHRHQSAPQEQNQDAMQAGRDHHHGGQVGGDHHYGSHIAFPHMMSDLNFVSWRLGVTFGLF